MIVEFIKTNYLLFSVIFIVIIIIIFFYFFNRPSSGTPGLTCTNGEVLGKCEGVDTCIPLCRDDQMFDCNQKACVCKNGGEDCGNSLCCNKDNCKNSINNDGIDIKNADGSQIKTCCHDEQRCGADCCNAGYSCVNGRCSKGCGNIKNICENDEICFSADNIANVNSLNEIKNTDKNITIGNTSYMCVKQNACQIKISENPQGAPRIINNFYPCINGTYSRIENGENKGIGFCYSKNDTETDIKECKGKNYTSCNGSCEWVDIFSEVKNNSIESLNNKVERMSKYYMGNVDGTKSTLNGKGSWCYDNNLGGTNRLIAQKLDNTGSCSVKDCWNRLAQSNVNDITYDSRTGMCLAIQDCKQKSPLKFNSEKNKLLKAISDTSYLNKCDGTSNCNSSITQNGSALQCNGDGTITNSPLSTTYKQLPNETNVIDCVVKYDGSGNYTTKQACLDNIQCPPGFVKGKDIRPYEVKVGDWKLTPPELQITDEKACYRQIPTSSFNDFKGAGVNSQSENTPIKYYTRYGNWGSSGDNFGRGDTSPVIPLNAYYCKGTIDTEDAIIHPTGWVKCATSGGCENPHFIDKSFDNKTGDPEFFKKGIWHERVMKRDNRDNPSEVTYRNYCYCDPGKFCRNDLGSY